MLGFSQKDGNEFKCFKRGPSMVRAKLGAAALNVSWNSFEPFFFLLNKRNSLELGLGVGTRGYRCDFPVGAHSP